MNKQPATIRTYLFRGAFLLSLLGLIVIPLALGQGNGGKRSVAANVRHAASSAPGALAGTHSPAKPDTNRLPNDQPQRVVSAAQPAIGAWTLGTPYPTTIVRYGFAQTATHFYVFGGVDNGSTTTAVNRMDLATGMWQSRAPMPFSDEAPTCALDDSAGIVYCADGFGTNQFAAYNIASDSWTSLAPDPFVSDHYGSASGFFNGQVFVAGGTSSFSNQVDVYHVGTNTWSSGTPAPIGPFLLAGYQQVGQYLYVVGGFDPTAVNYATTLRLDMRYLERGIRARHSPSNWQTLALPMIRERTSSTRWAETCRMMVTSSTRPTRSMSSMCQHGPEEPGLHHRLFCRRPTVRRTRPGSSEMGTFGA